jgi:chromosome partitioning protein
MPMIHYFTATRKNSKTVSLMAETEMVNNIDLYVTVKEVAQLLGTSPQAIGKLIREKSISKDYKNRRTQILRPENVRQILELKGLKYPKVTMGLHVCKGGTGKTTMSHGFATRAAALGFRTLAIDLDSQGNLSSSFGIIPKLQKDPSMLEVVNGKIGSRKITAKDAIVKIAPFLSLIPATMALSTLDATIMVNQHNVEKLFKKALSDVADDFDFIVFDCPPSLSLTTAAVHCCKLDGFEQRIVMPLAPDQFSKDGLVTTLTHFHALVKKHDIKPEVDVVLNMMDLRTKLAIDLLKEISQDFGEILHPNYIAIDQDIKNALRNKVCLWSQPNKATEDLHTVLVELLNLEIWKNDWKVNPFVKKNLGRHSNIRNEVAQ